MSEKPQHTESGTPEIDMLNEILDRAMPNIPDPPEEDAPDDGAEPGSGAPAETQRSIFDGEERDSGADEQSSSGPTENPSEKPATPAPGKNKPSSVYVYLAVLFGAAFLMLLLAYFVQQRNNDAVQDDLELLTASRQELLDNIKTLEEERDQLQKEVEYQKGRVAQKNEETEQLQSAIEDSTSRWSDQRIQTMTLDYFWYIDQFMENKEYFMAASAVVFGAEHYRTTWNSQVSINPAQVEQYEAYRQELIDRGYLEQSLNISTLDHISPTKLCFTQKWDPSQHEDMAALCILWCALDQHFVKNNDNVATQYLSLNPLGDPASGYQQRVERLASDFTLEQFQLMKDALVENKWLVIAEDGTMSEGFSPTGFRDDVLYNLPFELPIDPAQISLH